MHLHFAPRRRLRRILFAAATALAVAVAGAASPAAAETWEIAGRVYLDVRVREVTPASVTIFHRGGIAQLDLAALPAGLQARFGFEPAKADAWRARADRALTATHSTTRDKNAPRTPPTAATPAAGEQAPDPAAPEAADAGLRAEVDLRPLFRQYGLFLKDQGRRPSCSIFAFVGAAEYETARHFGRADPLSEEFLVWAVHQILPDVSTDDGYHFGEVLSAVQQYGVPRRDLVPNTFGRAIKDISPSADAIFDAASRRHFLAIWFRTDSPDFVGQLVDALNQETPVVIGLRWPQPSTLEHNNLLRDQRPLAGAGHAVTLVGYRCADGLPGNLVFIFRNSYGVSWGLGGCGFVAARYVRDNVIAAFALRIRDDSTGEIGVR